MMYELLWINLLLLIARIRVDLVQCKPTTNSYSMKLRATGGRNGTNCPIENCVSCEEHKELRQGCEENIKTQCINCGNMSEVYLTYVTTSVTELKKDDNVNISAWKCLECRFGYTWVESERQCIACREIIDNCTGCRQNGSTIECTQCDEDLHVDRRTSCKPCGEIIQNCTECHSNNGKTVCGQCAEEFYVEGRKSCRTCRSTIDNCRTCHRRKDHSLVCTSCEHGYFFDYYGKCSPCNETIPHCTNCSSFEACRIFGPVQNLTCHDCEENYFVGDDKESCTVDCRNISSYCDNCSLKTGVCLSCSSGKFLNETINTCVDCSESVSQCETCAVDNQSKELRCSSCEGDFGLSPDNRSCRACSDPHCHKCVVKDDTGEDSEVCVECDVGFSPSRDKDGCTDCGEITAHCDLCDGQQNECKGCVPPYTLTHGKCEVTKCGIPPPPPLRGGYAFTGTEYGDKVTYDCECGYDIEGKQTLTCGINGIWGRPPCCRRRMVGLSLISKDCSRQYFTDATVLTCLDSVSGAHRNILKLYYNFLTEVPVLTHYKELDTLSELWLFDNEIREFVWENVPVHTEVLHLHDNQLETLPKLGRLDVCLSVRVMNVHRNDLRTVSADCLPLSLEELHLIENKITHLGDLSGLNKLRWLDLEYNELTTVTGDQLPASLEKLALHKNRITHLGDLSGLNKLRWLGLKLNNLTTVTGDHLPDSLKKLELYKNRITHLGDLSGLNNLRWLGLAFNKLTTIKADQLPASLWKLELNGNPINRPGKLNLTVRNTQY